MPHLRSQEMNRFRATTDKTVVDTRSERAVTKANTLHTATTQLAANFRPAPPLAASSSVSARQDDSLVDRFSNRITHCSSLLQVHTAGYRSQPDFSDLDGASEGVCVSAPHRKTHADSSSRQTGCACNKNARPTLLEIAPSAEPPRHT